MIEKPIIWIIDGEWTDHEVEKQIFADLGYLVKVTHPDNLEKELPLYKQSAVAVIVQISFNCDAIFINELEACKVIAVYGAGFNNIDLKAASTKKIPVYNIPDYCVEEVSDHTVSLFYAVGRRLKSYQKQIENGKWDALDTLPIKRFRDMTIGLIGFGRIARLVAEKMSGTGAEIIAHDKYCAEAVFKENNVTSVSLEDLLKYSDIISLHVPLTKETENLLDYTAMKQMKKGSMIVNTCRGGIVQENDLARMLDEGHLSGAGIDVFVNEPINKDNPLLDRDNVFITPHSSYVSDRSFTELKQRICQVIIDEFNDVQKQPMLNQGLLATKKVDINEIN